MLSRQKGVDAFDLAIYLARAIEGQLGFLGRKMKRAEGKGNVRPPGRVEPFLPLPAEVPVGSFCVFLMFACELRFIFYLYRRLLGRQHFYRDSHGIQQFHGRCGPMRWIFLGLFYFSRCVCFAPAPPRVVDMYNASSEVRNGWKDFPFL